MGKEGKTIVGKVETAPNFDGRCTNICLDTDEGMVYGRIWKQHTILRGWNLMVTYDENIHLPDNVLAVTRYDILNEETKEVDYSCDC